MEYSYRPRKKDMDKKIIKYFYSSKFLSEDDLVSFDYETMLKIKCYRIDIYKLIIIMKLLL